MVGFLYKKKLIENPTSLLNLQSASFELTMDNGQLFLASFALCPNCQLSIVNCQFQIPSGFDEVVGQNGEPTSGWIISPPGL